MAELGHVLKDVALRVYSYLCMGYCQKWGVTDVVWEESDLVRALLRKTELAKMCGMG